MKTLLKNSIIYIVFLSNTVYSMANGFTWIYWVTAAFTLLAFFLDIMEVMHDAGR